MVSDAAFSACRRAAAVLVCIPGAGGVVNENDSYVLIGRHLHRHGVPVPEIYDSCREEGGCSWRTWGFEPGDGVQSVCGIRRRRFYEQALNIWQTCRSRDRGFNPACASTPSMTPAFCWNGKAAISCGSL